MSAWSNSMPLTTTMSGRYFRNLAVLSKNALSYSSPSITNGPPPTRPLAGRSFDTPPTRNPASTPASFSAQAVMNDVVVLPCVPAMTIGRRPRRNLSRTSSGSEQ